MIDFGRLTDVPAMKSTGMGNRFRVLLLADPGAIDAAPWTLYPVDRDSIESLMERLAPAFELPPLKEGGQPSRLTLRSIDDLHPDALFQQSSELEDLRRIKRQLAGPNAAAAIAEIRRWSPEGLDSGGEGPSPAEISGPVEPRRDPRVGGEPPAEVTRENWFESILAESDAAQRSEEAVWQRAIRQLIAPIAVKTVEPDWKRSVAVVDRAIELGLRRILQARPFRQIESFWRGLEWLIRRVDSDRSVRIDLAACSWPQLAADLLAADDLSATDAYRQLVTRTVETPGGEPWTVIVVLHELSLGESSLGALGRLVRVAAAAGTATVAGVPSDEAAWEEPQAAERWRQLAGMNESRHLAALVPPFLLRLPYGGSGGQVEGFAFEEFPAPGADRLWGHPGWLATAALATQFEERGGSIDPTAVATLSGFPTHVVDEEIAIAGERLLRERDIERWIARGVTPVVSYKDSDRLQIDGFQSIARTPWRGRWGG